MKLKVRNRLITEPIIDILYAAKRELTNGKLKDIQDRNSDILITCPKHKGGHERNPSCRVYSRTDDEKLDAGRAHCFSCGYVASMPELIGDLFDQDSYFGEEWLIERFGNIFIQQEEYLPAIELDKPQTKSPIILSEDILIPFDYYHPYMWERKLSREVVDRFRVGYDHERDAITFPVYDEKHRLVMVTARSVKTKRFWIPQNVDKPVYLLYDIIERGVNTVYVCESQINTLTLRTWGFDSVGLFGTGSYKQFETLRKIGIRNYILVFDGDEAGRKGALRFKNNMPNDIFITDVRLPAGKDVNELTIDEFRYLLSQS